MTRRITGSEAPPVGVVGEPHSVERSTAHALRAPVSRGLIAALGGTYLGTWIALLPVIQLTLALRVQTLAPDNKAQTLSLVLAVGAAVALFSQNIFGMLSDRTTSRFGMRRPWIAAGAVLGAASLIVLAFAPNIAVLVGSWALVQLSFNVLLAGLSPVLPDQVPSAQLGRVSAIIGFTSPLGLVLGAIIAQILLPNLAAAIIAPGVLTLLGALVLVLVLRDRRLDPAQRPPLRAKSIVRAYWVDPRQAPDFAWAWLSKFLVSCGSVTLLSYQTYFLMSRFGYTTDTVAPIVVKILLVHTVAVVISSIVAGAASDRLRRRKPFVVLSALALAPALALAAFSDTMATYFVAIAISGTALGCFLAVDLALVTEVLPSAADAGKDMGILHLANALPQTLAPIVAPIFLAIGGSGENYPAFFLAGAALAAVGALCNLRIRSVK